MPKKHEAVFAKLRARVHGRVKNLTLHARARQIMANRRSSLRRKQWHGGKAYAGPKRHVIRAQSVRHRHAKAAGLTSKQMLQRNYLAYGKRVL